MISIKKGKDRRETRTGLKQRWMLCCVESNSWSLLGDGGGLSSVVGGTFVVVFVCVQ